MPYEVLKCRHHGLNKVSFLSKYILCIMPFSLKVHVYYDEPFYKKFGQDSKSIVTRINAVFSMVKTIYSDRGSLTTVIIPKIIQIQHVKQAVWKATVDDLR